MLCDSAFLHSNPKLTGKLVHARKENELGTHRVVPFNGYSAVIEIVIEKTMRTERYNAESGVRAI